MLFFSPHCLPCGLRALRCPLLWNDSLLCQRRNFTVPTTADDSGKIVLPPTVWWLSLIVPVFTALLPVVILTALQTAYVCIYNLSTVPTERRRRYSRQHLLNVVCSQELVYGRDGTGTGDEHSVAVECTPAVVFVYFIHIARHL